MHLRQTTWLLVLLTLLVLHTTQAHQHMAEDCFEYCLQCGDNPTYASFRTPNVTLRGSLEVSLQVGINGTLPMAMISLPGAKPSAYVSVNRENVTLHVGRAGKLLKLTSPQPAFSWITLVLASTAQDTLLVYNPKNDLHVLTSNISHRSLAFVSSSVETHVAFNCVSGCRIHSSSKGLLVGNIQLQPPFTMYLNPRPLQRGTHVLTLFSKGGANTTVEAGKWTPGMWHRVKILVAKNEKQQKEVILEKGEDGVMEVRIWVTNETHTFALLTGFRWTLHCAPKELTDTSTSSAGPETGNNTATTPTSGREEGEGKGDEGDESKQKTRERGAGAGQVTAWVMAGLALFLVMVLALALCTKTAQSSQHHHALDSQPSVGIVYFKGGTREPEEDSEPESPNELKVPSFRNSLKCKTVEG